jgi:hypothetical protein
MNGRNVAARVARPQVTGPGYAHANS